MADHETDRREDSVLQTLTCWFSLGDIESERTWYDDIEDLRRTEHGYILNQPR